MFYRCHHRTGGALSYKPERSTGIIEACFRLHNKAVDENIPINRDDPLPIPIQQQPCPPTTKYCSASYQKSNYSEILN
jgi:hypothetical protein